MDTRQLRYFSAVCECRNLSHAADRCNVAASALSHHIARLEEELETPLFTRRPRGMEPTAAGLKLLVHARAILAAFEDAAADIRHGQAEISGAIAVGMPCSVINVIGADLMRAVLKDLPKVRLLIREGLSGVTYDALRAGEVEAALIFNPAPDGQTERLPLIEEALYCIGRPEITGDPDTPIRLEEMARLPLAMLQSGALSRALADRPAELAKLEGAARIQLASVAATQAVMREGLACVLAPKALASAELAAGLLCARPVVDPAPVRTLHLVTEAGARPTPLRERMGAIIADLVRAAAREGRWDGARLVAG